MASLVQTRPCDISAKHSSRSTLDSCKVESRACILSSMSARSAVRRPSKLRISRFAALQPLALGILSHATPNQQSGRRLPTAESYGPTSLAEQF